MKLKRALGLTALLSLIIAGVISIGSCTTVYVDGQSILLTPAEIYEKRQELKQGPIELQRPVVVLSGYHAWPTMAGRLKERIAMLTEGNEDRVISVAYTFKGDFNDMVPHAIREIEKRFPSDDPDETIEVDVIGISAGGLVARAAALPLADNDPRPKRLKINRLFTMGSPHRGAILAEKIALDAAAKDMIRGSAFLTRLDEALPEIDYEIYPYTNLNDTWVGATRASPVGMVPYWTGGRKMFSHFGVSDNWMFILDIAMRLRGETPIAAPPSEPPRD